MIATSGATAGATLTPMVMKAQIMAAKADRIWVRAYWVMLIPFRGTGPLRLCEVLCMDRAKTDVTHGYRMFWYSWLQISIGIFSLVGK
jgi:hypothetical protein